MYFQLGAEVGTESTVDCFCRKALALLYLEPVCTCTDVFVLNRTGLYTVPSVVLFECLALTCEDGNFTKKGTPIWYMFENYGAESKCDVDKWSK